MTVTRELEASFLDRFAEYGRTLDCVHCGLCVASCPTFEITGRETDSPRGRIYAMRSWAEGREPLTTAVLSHLDRCIVCRACETHCPAGVRMGELVEAFRDELEHDGARSVARAWWRLPWRRWLGRFLMQNVLPHRGRIAALSDLIWAYQASRVARLVDLVLPRLSKRLADVHAMQPPIPRPALRRIATGVLPAIDKPRLRVGLFLGCIASDWFAATHRATIRVLRRNGCEVVIPPEQTCCGALHRHTGMLGEARELERRNSDAFRAAGVDLIVVNAAGCGAALKEPLVVGGGEVPVRDVCELLEEIGIVPPLHPLVCRVAYDQPCHLQHAQRIGAGVVERLIGTIPGVELVALAHSDRCCGSGGVYNLLHPELATPLRDDKIAAIRSAAPDIVVTGNPGCILQIRSGLGADDRVEVMHPIDLLDRSYHPAGRL